MCPQNSLIYFPAVILAEFDSAEDALKHLCIPHSEAMNLIVAHWQNDFFKPPKIGNAIIAEQAGGRNVAAIYLENGRFAACNAYLAEASFNQSAAAEQLKKYTLRGKVGIVGFIKQNFLEKQNLS